jgi:exopolysaccharide biosynthesis polyprenyl glycosylphosphotransferase
MNRRMADIQAVPRGPEAVVLPVQRAGSTVTPGLARADSDLAATVPPPAERRRWVRRYAAAAALADVTAMLLALGATHLLHLADGARTVPAAVLVLVLFPLGWVLAVHLAGGYGHGTLGAGSEEFRSLPQAGVVVMAGIAFFSYALDVEVTRGLVVLAIPGAVVLSAVGRYALRRRVHHLRLQGRCMRTVIAVGRECAVLELVRQVRRDRHCGMEIRAACVPNPQEAYLLRAEGVAVVGDLSDVAHSVHALGVDAVAVTSSSETAAAYLRRLSWDLEGSGVELLVAPGLMEVAGPRMHMRPFIGLPLLHVEEPEFTGSKRLVKEVVDRLGAGLVLLAAAPVLLAIALAVRLDSPGPVLFRQIRIGRGGREFSMLKFRTMVVDAEQQRAALLGLNESADGLLFKIADDPRVTRAGRLLRRLSLDELPQLLNVLGGRMSLVGPRPPLPDEVALYDDSVRRRLLVKPGLTGLWQVSGRSDLTWEESVRLDLRYVENWSLLLDLMILWKTGSAVVRARGAY